MENNEVKQSTFNWLKAFARKHKMLYATSVVSATIGVAFSVAPYFIIAKIVMKLIAGEKDVTEFYPLIAILGLLWIGKVLFHSLSTTLSHKATFKVIEEIRISLNNKLMRVPMGYLVDTPSGEIKNTIVEKTDAIEPTLAHALPEMTANLLLPIAIISYMFSISWYMALISLVTLPIGIIFFEMMKRGYISRYSNYLNKNKKLNSVAVEYINGIEVIKTFNQSTKSFDKFTLAATEAAHSAIDWMKDCQVYYSLSFAIFPATLVTVLPFGTYFYLQGMLSGVDLIMMIILSVGAIPPLVTAFSYTDDIAKVQSIVSDITDILLLPELTRPESGIKISSYDISFKNVDFSYCSNIKVLQSLSLTIPQGKFTALVGSSGSGKSTVAKLIVSQWEANRGDIFIGGSNIKDIPLNQINKLIAYVSQDTYLFDTTIMENIRMGKLDASDEEVINIAKKSGCHEFIMQLSSGYQTKARGAGSGLSGGEKQRISIARAMLKDTPIIVLDEATAYTDPSNEAIIQESVNQLVKGKTLIVIAHRLSTIKEANKIIVIENGKVASEGTHQELLLKSGLYKNMWESHVQLKLK